MKTKIYSLLVVLKDQNAKLMVNFMQKMNILHQELGIVLYAAVGIVGCLVTLPIAKEFKAIAQDEM